MITVDARCGVGQFTLSIEGHADDDPICAAITAFEQTAMIFFEQLAENRPADVQFTLTPALEMTP